MDSSETAAAHVAWVGRAGTIAQLRHSLAAAAGGRGGIVLVRGEAGVGKTRLVEQAVSGVSSNSTSGDEPLVLWARCRDGAPALWPWLQFARSARRQGADLLDPIVDVLDDRGTDADPTDDIRSGHDRFQRFDHMAEALIAAGNRRPMVLVLDDAQWADDDSLDLLSFLAADITRTRICLIATIRIGEDPATKPPGRYLTADPAVVTIDLEGLTGDDLKALLDTLVGATPNSDVVVAVAQYTGGNPFFVREVAALLRASGRAHDAGSWRGLLPEGVRAVLGRRFARLPHSSHRALGAAAVAGVEFDITLVAALLEVDRPTAHNLLDPSVSAGLVARVGDGRMRFAHALVRDSALDEMSGSRRRELHQRAAEYLMVQGHHAAAEVAGHLLSAGEVDRAQSWLVTAGRQASAAAMHADAAAWLQRALDLTPPGPGDVAGHCDLLIEFAAAAARCGRRVDSADALDQAVRLARTADLPEALGRAALGVGSLGGAFEVQLLNPAHQALLEEALQRTAAVDSSLRSWLLARLSVAGSLSVDDARRARLADEAVEIARRVGDDAALAHALAAYCDSRAGPEFLAQRLLATGEMLAAATRSGDPELELLALRMRIIAEMERGNVGGARRDIHAFARLADRLRQPQFRWYARLMEGMLAHLAGDLETAGALCEAALAEGRAAASNNAEMIVGGGLMPSIMRDRGDPEAARRWLRDAAGPHPEAARGLDPSPLILLDHGADLDDVRRVIASLPSDDPIAENDSIYLFFAAMVARAAAVVGARSVASKYCDKLAAFSDMMVLDGWAAACYGPVSLFLGRAAEALGDSAAACDFYERALARIVPMAAPLLEADVRARLDALDRRPRESAPATFARDGELWEVAFGGSHARFVDAKGMHDLASLLSRPGREVHVLDLVGADESVVSRRSGPSAGLGPALDERGRRAYEGRIRDLTDEIEEAESHNDIGRAARADDEREQLLKELARSLGLSGRKRSAGPDASERARKAVGMRIRSAISKIDSELPELGRHLHHAIRTGMYCAYEPESPTTWRT